MATATIATTPTATPPRKTASIKYATDAALPFMTASPHDPPMVPGTVHVQICTAREELRGPGCGLADEPRAHHLGMPCVSPT